MLFQVHFMFLVYMLIALHCLQRNWTLASSAILFWIYLGRNMNSQTLTDDRTYERRMNYKDMCHKKSYLLYTVDLNANICGMHLCKSPSDSAGIPTWSHRKNVSKYANKIVWISKPIFQNKILQTDVAFGLAIVLFPRTDSLILPKNALLSLTTLLLQS